MEVDFLEYKLAADLSNSVDRKFEETFIVSDWEIETDTGFSSIKNIGKTIPYEVWEVTTSSGKSLKCADDHILFDDTYDQIFVKDLNKDSRPDRIITADGAELVSSVIKYDVLENMYDLEVDHPNHRYFTNSILSHNSIWLANDAANFVRMGHNVVFITAEMSAQKVVKRIGANLLNINMSEYDEKSVNRDFVKRKLERISRGLLPPGKLFVKEFPTSQATILDIESYLKELEESQDHKVNVLIVDYINILSNYRNPNTENTYMKIKQIAEDLRALAVKKDILVISATQLNRGAWDSTEIKMENIAESAGLAHTADVMYALIQDSMMHANREYWLKVLKIRDGEGKGNRCRFNIDYNFMRLTETDDIT
jgi:KaiC/GvpD/RAD55 family RecA-like ATPase